MNIHKISLMISLMKWKIKRYWHYFFGKEPFESQIGDYVYIIDNALLSEIKFIFADQITSICSSHRYELIKTVNIITINPTPEDPYGQTGTAAWKAIVLVHTRKSWNKYLKTLIKKEIKFKKGSVK
ncbi:MAG: hypothetical protein LLG40_14015 [Deltaproteobacteria bacterium]|nr:hypothetical protein [Deltaproteobacteria bacterium]